jgi:hypothetical protein
MDKVSLRKKENLSHAISLIGKKSKRTEFDYRLSGLNDKIRRYKIKFGEWDSDHVYEPKTRIPSAVPSKRMNHNQIDLLYRKTTGS